MTKTKRIEAELLSFVIVLGLFYCSLAGSAAAGEISIPNVIKLVNEDREKNGVAKLKENEKLNQVAADKLADMVENGYFAHTSPLGLNPWYWFSKNNYDYEYAGENLAVDFLTAERQERAWMNSESHRKNILNPNYEEIGVAVGTMEKNGKISIVTVQVFGASASSGAKANDPENFQTSQNSKVSPDGTVLSSRDMKFGRDYYRNQSQPLEWKEENAEQVKMIWWGALIVFALMMAAFPGVMVVVSHKEIYHALSLMNELETEKYFRSRPRKFLR